MLIGFGAEFKNWFENVVLRRTYANIFRQNVFIVFFIHKVILSCEEIEMYNTV